MHRIKSLTICFLMTCWQWNTVRPAGGFSEEWVALALELRLHRFHFALNCRCLEQGCSEYASQAIESARKTRWLDRKEEVGILFASCSV